MMLLTAVVFGLQLNMSAIVAVIALVFVSSINIEFLRMSFDILFFYGKE